MTRSNTLFSKKHYFIKPIETNLSTRYKSFRFVFTTSHALVWKWLMSRVIKWNSDSEYWMVIRLTVKLRDRRSSLCRKVCLAPQECDLGRWDSSARLAGDIGGANAAMCWRAEGISTVTIAATAPERFHIRPILFSEGSDALGFSSD